MDFIYVKIPKINFTPRNLGIIFLLIGVIFSGVIFAPLEGAFAGKIKVNQKIDIFQNTYVDFKELGISGVTNSLGWEEQLPIGNISIRFYSILMLVGVLSGYFLTLYFAKRNSISGVVIDRLVIGFVLFGLIGSRIFFVIFNLDYYHHH